jgi:hypothetical protein
VKIDNWLSIITVSQSILMTCSGDLLPENWVIHNMNFLDGKITLKGAEIHEEKQIFGSVGDICPEAVGSRHYRIYQWSNDPKWLL